jgi:hypothetical protein
MEVGFFSFGVGVVLQGFQILWADEKTKKQYKRFLSEHEIWNSYLHIVLIFEGAGKWIEKEC